MSTASGDVYPGGVPTQEALWLFHTLENCRILGVTMTFRIVPPPEPPPKPVPAKNLTLAAYRKVLDDHWDSAVWPLVEKSLAV